MMMCYISLQTKTSFDRNGWVRMISLPILNLEYLSLTLKFVINNNELLEPSVEFFFYFVELVCLKIHFNSMHM